MILSKKAFHRLFEVLKPFGVKHHELESAMAGSAIPAQPLDPTRMAAVYESVPEILRAIASRHIGITAFDACTLSSVLRHLATTAYERNALADVVINVPLGGSEHPPSLRLPAYLLAACRTLEQLDALRARGIVETLPCLRIYKCDHIAHCINGLSLEAVSRVSRLTFSFIDAFLSEFFPRLRPYVRFENDIDYFDEDAISGHGTASTQIAALAAVLPQIEGIADDLESIRQMAAKYVKVQCTQDELRRGALYYAAAHPVYDLSIQFPETRVGATGDSPALRPSFVIVHGGLPQQRFIRLAKAILQYDALPKTAIVVPTAYVTLNAGKRPVYYEARDGDRMLGEPLRKDDIAGLDAKAQSDFQLLFDELGCDDYIAFVQRLSESPAISSQTVNASK